MRKLIVSVLASADGYFEGPGNALDKMPFEDAFNTHNLALLRRTETLVYGSRWFSDNWSAWSAVAADDDQSPRDHEIAARVLGMDAVVVSDSMTVGVNDPWASTTRVVSRGDAVEELASLKAADGGDILMFGSATTWSPLASAGLVDELILLVGAALMGEGSKLYQGPRLPLRLISVEQLAGSQLVALRYALDAAE
jgi:dihydrofolate reductase